MALNTALLGFLAEIIIKQTFVVDGIMSLGKVFDVKNRWHRRLLF